ncbi:MAG TPA: hypothetical protein VES42_25065 [Pilimelia sp.]|nr:hypothetical protein [Pilimelia sp.]
MSTMGVLLAFTAAAGPARAAGPAAGAPDPAATPTDKPVGIGMRLAGFDAAVARANGYAVVTLPDGSQASVPADKAAAARKGEYVPTTGVLTAEQIAGKDADGGMSTNNYAELPGDCGKSYVALWAQGGARATLHTGFHLIPSAGQPWDVEWRINIEDNGGRSTQPYNEQDGAISGNSWIAHLRLLNLSYGWAQSTVIWYSSYTITTRGWVCWSAGPSTGAYIN